MPRPTCWPGSSGTWPPSRPGSAAGCAAAGARQVIAVIADTGSDASAALHRRFGFTQAGLLSGVGRKHGLWIDTLLMQKELESRGPTR